MQVRNEGGLWDESMGVYMQFGGHPREAFLEWEFPSGMRMKFAHLENEKTVYDWQGSQVPYLGFDELTHFSAKQFWYMLSRNRSMSGVPGYIRATCNPDCNSWVRNLVDWWIDDDGFPIKERSGVIRYFIRIDDTIIWADSKRELNEKYGKEQLPKSFTFIPSSIRDNRILMESDPSYLSNLMALSRVERMRLLEGNWNVRASAGSLFQKHWFPIVEAIPAGWTKAIRYWDRASTKPNESNPDPSWTVGLKLLKYPNNTYVVADIIRVRDTPLQIENYVRNTAHIDTYQCTVGLEEDPGQAGVCDIQNYARLLSGFTIKINKVTKDKVTRAKPVSSQCENGNIRVLKAKWNDAFFDELENFGEDMTGHSDIVDCLSGSFNQLSQDLNVFDYFLK